MPVYLLFGCRSHVCTVAAEASWPTKPAAFSVRLLTEECPSLCSVLASHAAPIAPDVKALTLRCE